MLRRMLIECFHVTSSPSRLQRKTENSRHVGVQRDKSFYGNLHETSDILTMLVICDHVMKMLYYLVYSYPNTSTSDI